MRATTGSRSGHAAGSSLVSLLAALFVLLGAAYPLPVAAEEASGACPAGNRAGLILDFGAVDDPLGGPRPVPALSWACVSPLRPEGGPAVSGLDLLARTGHTPRFNTGGLVCAIDGYPAQGCAETQPGGVVRYWSYWLHEPSKGPGWAYAGIGPSGRRLSDGAMDGWRYVETKLGDATPQPRQAPDWSVVCCTAPPVGLPQPPTAVTAVAGIASATVSWRAPAGPNPVTGYVVETSPGGMRTRVDAGMTSVSLPDLTPGRSYAFTVRAVNGAGESAASDPSSAVVPAAPNSLVPGAPTAAGARGGVREVTVTWVAPASDGGAPITGYRVEVTPGGRIVEATGTTVRVTGLEATDAYTFVVRAVNAAGASEPSPPTAAVAVTSVDPRLVPGRITTVAGTGTRGFGGDGAPAVGADLARPNAVAVDTSGNLYIVDPTNQRVRRVDAATGVITTIAGNGTRAYAGDGGPATEASLRDPSAVAVAPNGDVYIADTGNRRVRKVDAATGHVGTVMGTGAFADSGDGGPATEAAVGRPAAIASGADGAVYVVDASVGRIRRIDPVTGIVANFAGRGGEGYGGDGGPAVDAYFAFLPGTKLAVAPTGELLVTDSGNGRVRRIGTDGIVTTIAGGGPASGDGGPATGAELRGPAGVAVGPDGRVYISETGRIRVVDPVAGLIAGFAGNGTPGYAGDGLPATAASVYGASGLAVDAAGHVYLAEPDANRVRRVTGPDGVAPVVSLTSVPAGESPDRTASVAFTVDDPAAAVTCSLDGGPAAACASPWRGEALEQGPHTLAVTATDPAGNAGSATASWTVVPPAADDPAAVAAIAWITRELVRGDGVLDRAGTPDWGLTSDAVLALSAADPRGAAAAKAADEIANAAADYVTWDRDGKPGVLLAGPLAKVALTLAAQGRDATAIGGRDPEAELRSLMVTNGPDAGRFADRNPYAADTANNFGQAYAVLALARTRNGVPDAAVRHLLNTQCPSGGYRLMPGDATSCASDTDTTALVIQALVAVPRTDDVRDSLARAVGWLLSKQDTATGAFGGTGPTAAVNANSTGLIAQTLAATGQRDQAARAAEWLRSMALTRGTDAGALAYNAESLADALADGVDDITRDQWRRSTTQAVLGLGLPVLGDIGVADPAPIEPVVPANPGPQDPDPQDPDPQDPDPHDPDPNEPDPNEPRPDGDPTASASPATARPGETVTIAGGGFGPGLPVTAVITGEPASVELPAATADDDGEVAFTWTVPGDARPGPRTAELVDQGDGGTTTAAFEVVTTPGGGGGSGDPGDSGDSGGSGGGGGPGDSGGVGNQGGSGTSGPPKDAYLPLLPRTGTESAVLIALALAATAVGVALRRSARSRADSS